MTAYRDKTKPWYGTSRWKRIREAQRTRQPLCEYCLKQGRVTAMTICDHVVPHKGDEARFWSGPFQSLCKRCHDSDKQSEERTGRKKVRIGLDGWPEAD